MSDTMVSIRISVRISQALQRKLRRRATLKGRPESELVREALEKYLEQPATPTSAYEIARKAGLIGCIRGGPADLSTNPKYFEGFGEDPK